MKVVHCHAALAGAMLNLEMGELAYDAEGLPIRKVPHEPYPTMDTAVHSDHGVPMQIIYKPTAGIVYHDRSTSDEVRDLIVRTVAGMPNGHLTKVGMHESLALPATMAYEMDSVVQDKTVVNGPTQVTKILYDPKTIIARMIVFSDPEGKTADAELVTRFSVSARFTWSFVPISSISFHYMSDVVPSTFHDCVSVYYSPDPPMPPLRESKALACDYIRLGSKRRAALVIEGCTFSLRSILAEAFNRLFVQLPTEKMARAGIKLQPRHFFCPMCGIPTRHVSIIRGASCGGHDLNDPYWLCYHCTQSAFSHGCRWTEHEIVESPWTLPELCAAHPAWRDIGTIVGGKIIQRVMYGVFVIDTKAGRFVVGGANSDKWAIAPAIRALKLPIIPNIAICEQSKDEEDIEGIKVETMADAVDGAIAQLLAANVAEQEVERAGDLAAAVQRFLVAFLE